MNDSAGPISKTWHIGNLQGICRVSARNGTNRSCQLTASSAKKQDATCTMSVVNNMMISQTLFSWLSSSWRKMLLYQKASQKWSQTMKKQQFKCFFFYVEPPDISQIFYLINIRSKLWPPVRCLMLQTSARVKKQKSINEEEIRNKQTIFNCPPFCGSASADSFFFCVVQ